MSNLIEIRWHGRGGQGAKTASLLLADSILENIFKAFLNMVQKEWGLLSLLIIE